MTLRAWTLEPGARYSTPGVARYSTPRHDLTAPLDVAAGGDTGTREHGPIDGFDEVKVDGWDGRSTWRETGVRGQVYWDGCTGTG